ncbi:uncharacterized protein BT62DRAFT_787351 [Guyanagaster necrorhizus]|uniref:Uncharacterized protein n=1 Tax=Guyanagaster necrorhizus TaxID=856835 RepID=A0A9P8ATQ1_9AGAR|nr:uncharacterized protein BT62DRAFT_787351 [Guyanagaster necrorhizus MCA 3950]KAG7447663.1 hypothetical protein BT62DRAFT_787351 [Guyanagaster necrorhizus MCA 3950]
MYVFLTLYRYLADLLRDSIMAVAAATSVTVKDEEITPPRKKPHCRMCGMPMQGHHREPIYGTTVCPSEDIAYVSSVAASGFPPVKEEDVKPIIRRTPNARRRKSRVQFTPGPEVPQPRLFTKEGIVESSRMPGSIAPDNELMHAPPRMATWCQLGFVGFMGGASFFLLFYLVLVISD